MGGEVRVKYEIESLYDQYAPLLLGLCKRYCGNIEDAEDVLHDGFIKIIKNLDKFQERPSGTFIAWMKRIMVNTALNHIRDHSKERNVFSLDPYQEIMEMPDTGEEAPFGELDGVFSKALLQEMISALPPGYRTVFNLYVFESYSHKDIATVLDCSESTSKSQLFKARALLKKNLQSVLNKKLYQNEKR